MSEKRESVRCFVGSDIQNFFGVPVEELTALPSQGNTNFGAPGAFNIRSMTWTCPISPRTREPARKIMSCVEVACAFQVGSTPSTLPANAYTV